jgi:hypothetical protein
LVEKENVTVLLDYHRSVGLLVKKPEQKLSCLFVRVVDNESLLACLLEAGENKCAYYNIRQAFFEETEGPNVSKPYCSTQVRKMADLEEICKNKKTVCCHVNCHGQTHENPPRVKYHHS